MNRIPQSIYKWQKEIRKIQTFSSFPAHIKSLPLFDLNSFWIMSKTTVRNIFIGLPSTVYKKTYRRIKVICINSSIVCILKILLKIKNRRLSNRTNTQVCVNKWRTEPSDYPLWVMCCVKVERSWDQNQGSALKIGERCCHCLRKAIHNGWLLSA